MHKMVVLENALFCMSDTTNTFINSMQLISASIKNTHHGERCYVGSVRGVMCRAEVFQDDEVIIACGKWWGEDENLCFLGFVYFSNGWGSWSCLDPPLVTRSAISLSVTLLMCDWQFTQFALNRPAGNKKHDLIAVTLQSNHPRMCDWQAQFTASIRATWTICSRLCTVLMLYIPSTTVCTIFHGVLYPPNVQVP